MIKVNIFGSKGKTANVSDNNELFTVAQFSKATKVTLNVNDQGFTLVKPRALQKLIITGLIVNTDRNVGVNGAAIEIYESITEDSATIETSILSFDLAKNQTVVTSPLLIETNEGKFINAKSDDSNVNVTIIGYFVTNGQVS